MAIVYSALILFSRIKKLLIHFKKFEHCYFTPTI